MSKKMYPDNNIANLQSVVQYDLPVYRESKKGCYISFNAFDPEKGRMRRKRIKLNRIKGVKARRLYADNLIKRLTIQLSKGWNPWICKDTSNLKTFGEAVQRYTAYVEKMYREGLYRKETYAGYKSYVKQLSIYAEKTAPIFYVYQFDRSYCSNFLDHILLDRDNSPQTRNNYLNFLRVFSGYLVEKGYLQSRPTDHIQSISKRLFHKEREIIPKEVVHEIRDYLSKNDKHFLFACYFVYYCFIRPVELTRLHISDFDLQQSTVTLSANVSKNKKEQPVTVPKKVILLGLELGVFSAPMSHYLFSEGFHPGVKPITTKQFRDAWTKMRKALHFRPEYKFYSLKDTGITEMCEANLPSIDVRDQARHSSLSITEIYTQRGNKANKKIIDIDGSL